MKALALRRKKIGIGILRGQLLRLAGVFRQITVLELGQNRLQRPPKTVQDANRILQRNHTGCGDGSVVLRKKSALLGRVDQKRGAAIHAGLEQPDALFGSYPALHHHII